MIAAGQARRAGLISTQAIRTGASRTVLESIQKTGGIFMGWQNLKWLQDGAAIRVSIVGFDDGSDETRELDGQTVAAINASLSASVDTRTAKPLRENVGIAFQGPVKVGAFEIPGTLARAWLHALNPDGVSNRDVLKPWVNGMDVTRRPTDTWIIDFDLMSDAEASKYLLPFAHVEQAVKPQRLKNPDKQRRTFWWRLGRSGSDLKAASRGLDRLLVTPRVAKHRIWAWVPGDTLPDSRIYAVAREDDFSFGVLHSRVHEAWSLANKADHGVGNDPTYVAKTCFDPFPFPHPTVEQRAEIEKWAKYLNDVRGQLLLVDPKATLTGLYNTVGALRQKRDAANPVYGLLIAHERLDAAVAASYGWEWPLSDEDILARLLALNLERSNAEAQLA